MKVDSSSIESMTFTDASREVPDFYDKAILTTPDTDMHRAPLTIPKKLYSISSAKFRFSRQPAFYAVHRRILKINAKKSVTDQGAGGTTP